MPTRFRAANCAWLKQPDSTKEDLGREDPRAKKHLAALSRAAKGFLPECRHLRAETSPKPRLLVDKGRLTLDVRQLSDGERGMLALVEPKGAAFRISHLKGYGLRTIQPEL